MDKEIERLIDYYGNDVLRIAYIYLKDKHLAEDVFQEVFIKIYKNFEKFQGKSSEKTWILTITMNTCKDILRSAWIRKIIRLGDNESGNFEISNPSDSLDDAVIKRIEYKELLTEVMRLPRKYKELIILYYYEEISTSEISKILNLPEGTVRSRLFRAREMLKYSIGGKIEYEG
jgi:RNA polymerase sigma-70 factor (ECF subfamily)